MVRSMYSGVSGLSTHQTRMDTIGNNIANVNTYGFKSSRTTFGDIYYQSISSASAPTGGQGGTNPSQVGYGAQVGSVDLLMSRSTFSMTGQTMDVAIDGDGFLQVMDAAGNIYYTRAGMLNFDAAGNLVDTQGNYVLGVNGDPTGKAPGSERITVALPNVNPTQPSVEETINSKVYTLTAANNTKDGNVNFNFTSDASLNDSVSAVAAISSSGIVITFNANTTFNSPQEVNDAINAAILEANGGKEHVGGRFTLNFGEPALGASENFSSFTATGATSLTGEQLASTDFNTQYGSVDFGDTGAIGGFSPSGTVGSGFTGNGALGAFTVAAGAAPGDPYTVSLVVGGVTYQGTVDNTRTSTGKFNLVNTTAGADATDYIEINRPAYADITAVAATTPTNGTATPSTPSDSLGLGSKALTLRGGTEGGTQSIADMTGIAISGNGVIVGLDSQGNEVYIGRIDLATFPNQAGLTQSGSTTYAVSQNSGAPNLTQPGEAGAGQLVSGTLELSNVDLSREFSDMITTQRGYQANSRIITVSDTMLEELINLKR